MPFFFLWVQKGANFGESMRHRKGWNGSLPAFSNAPVVDLYYNWFTTEFDVQLRFSGARKRRHVLERGSFWLSATIKAVNWIWKNLREAIASPGGGWNNSIGARASETAFGLEHWKRGQDLLFDGPAGLRAIPSRRMVLGGQSGGDKANNRLRNLKHGQSVVSKNGKYFGEISPVGSRIISSHFLRLQPRAKYFCRIEGRSPSHFQRDRTGDTVASGNAVYGVEQICQAKHSQQTRPRSLALGRRNFFQWNGPRRGACDNSGSSSAFFPGKIPPRQTGPARNPPVGDDGKVVFSSRFAEPTDPLHLI